MRGKAKVQTIKGIVPEYAQSAKRYFGGEQGEQWVAQVGAITSEMGRIVIRPDWVWILDMETRFPSAISPRHC